MRITSGKFRNRLIGSPSGDNVRPTTDRTRQALFNRLQSRVNLDGASVLDLFCGSGAVGLEALSRGAESAVFVDSDRRSLQLAESNAKSLDVKNNVSFVRVDVLEYLTRADRHFDLVFADPPYAYNEYDDLIEKALGVTSPDGYLVVEHDSSEAFDVHPSFVVSGNYGRTSLTFFMPSR